MDDTRNQDSYSDRHREVPQGDEIDLQGCFGVICEQRGVMILLCGSSATTAATIGVFPSNVCAATAATFPPFEMSEEESELSSELLTGKRCLLRKKQPAEKKIRALIELEL